MKHPTTPNPTGRPCFKVHSGLELEAKFGSVAITSQLTVDEALSLAMILLYEAREQVARQQAQGSDPR